MKRQYRGDDRPFTIESDQVSRTNGSLTNFHFLVNLSGDWHKGLNRYIYDSTNGTFSDGDILYCNN